MAIGLTTALPCVVLPWLLEPKADRAKPLEKRYWVKANIWIAILSFIGNYLWTHYFYTILGAAYTFPSWRLNDVRPCLQQNGMPAPNTSACSGYMCTRPLKSCFCASLLLVHGCTKLASPQTNLCSAGAHSLVPDDARVLLLLPCGQQLLHQAHEESAGAQGLAGSGCGGGCRGLRAQLHHGLWRDAHHCPLPALQLLGGLHCLAGQCITGCAVRSCTGHPARGPQQ